MAMYRYIGVRACYTEYAANIDNLKGSECPGISVTVTDLLPLSWVSEGLTIVL